MIENATRVSIHGMFDCHLFKRYTGSTVDAVIESWLEHISKPIPANLCGEKVDDLGPTYLCPAIVLCGDREIRRVGKMVIADTKTRLPRANEVEAYRQALLADPDIPRLLADDQASRKRYF